MEKYGEISKKNCVIRTPNLQVMISIGWKHALRSLRNRQRVLSTTRVYMLRI